MYFCFQQVIQTNDAIYLWNSNTKHMLNLTGFFSHKPWILCFSRFIDWFLLISVIFFSYFKIKLQKKILTENEHGKLTGIKLWCKDDDVHFVVERMTFDWHFDDRWIVCQLKHF